MKDNIENLKKTAKIAGFWYFVMLISSPLGLMYIPSQIVKKEDVIETAKNILDAEFLFRTGILSTLIGQISFIFLALYLYKLLKDVNKNYAFTMIALVIISIPITFVSEIFSITALHLLKQPAYLNTFDPNQIKSFALLSLSMREYGMIVAGIFWGLWLFPFGYLVIKSEFLPKILGILLMVGCFSYLLDSSLAILAPLARENITDILLLPLGIGEIATIFYLLIKGVRREKMATD